MGKLILDVQVFFRVILLDICTICSVVKGLLWLKITYFLNIFIGMSTVKRSTWGTWYIIEEGGQERILPTLLKNQNTGITSSQLGQPENRRSHHDCLARLQPDLKHDNRWEG